MQVCDCANFGTVARELGDLSGPTALHPMLAGLLCSTAAMAVVSLATQRIAPVPAHIVDAMEESARL